MLYTLDVRMTTACEGIDLIANQVCDTLVGKISTQVFWSAVIDQYIDVMDIS